MPTHEYTDDDPVVAQYERWTFPRPVDDLNDPSIARYLDTFQTLKYLTPAYWPRGVPREDLDVLVAGCGTMAAACMAYTYPQHRVVGIDISRGSLAHEERLKQRYNLTNLTLVRCPLEEVSSLGNSFDYVASHGVLHHTPAPAVALQALGGALRTDGVVALMVYAKYGRLPVYMMQELFHLLGFQPTESDVALARNTLENLPPEHPLKPSLAPGTFEMGSDAAVVDMFLHPRDVSYSAADCVALVRDAGLVFQGWDQNQNYYPDATLPAGSPLRERIDRLPLAQQWHAMELLTGRIHTHWFYACRADRNAATYRIPWDSDELLNWIPLRAARLAQRPGADGLRQYAMVVEGMVPVPLTPMQTAIFSQIDGARTVAQCLAAANLFPADGRLPEIARNLLQLLVRSGYGLVCAKR
jgi:SAM-dependent methyltransferase